MNKYELLFRVKFAIPNDLSPGAEYGCISLGKNKKTSLRLSPHVGYWYREKYGQERRCFYCKEVLSRTRPELQIHWGNGKNHSHLKCVPEKILKKLLLTEDFQEWIER